MGNETQVRKQISSIPALAMDEGELLDVLCSSLYPGAARASAKLVLNYCRAAGLDPMQKPVHIVPMWDSKANANRDVVMPGIGLYRTQAARSGEYAGVSDAEFGPEVQQTFGAEKYYDRYDKKDKTRDSVSAVFPAWCKVVVKRLMPNGAIAEFSATERWLENYATVAKGSAHPNSMWSRRPYAQLAKCAEAQALRKAFPEFGAQPTADEMEGRELDMGAADVVGDEAETTKKPAAPARKSTPAAEPQEPTDAQIVSERTKSAAAASAGGEPDATAGVPVTAGMLKHLEIKAKQAGKTDADLCAEAGVDSLDKLTVANVNALLKWLQG